MHPASVTSSSAHDNAERSNSEIAGGPLCTWCAAFCYDYEVAHHVFRAATTGARNGFRWCTRTCYSGRMRGIASTLYLGLAVATAACISDPSSDEPSDSDPGAPSPYWAANSITDEVASSHLWIVDRAGDVLGAHLDIPAASRARARLTDATCKTRWQQGLYDADYRHQYNGGWFDLTPTSSTSMILASGATWASHFYDPDTGKNYQGDTSPTAKTEATSHISAAKKKLAG